MNIIANLTELEQIKRGVLDASAAVIGHYLIVSEAYKGFRLSRLHGIRHVWYLAGFVRAHCV